MKPREVKEEVGEIKHQDDDLETDQNKSPALKFRILFLIIAFVVATILLLIAVPSFFENSALKTKIEDRSRQFLGSGFTIKGDVEIVLFPYPAIIAKDVFVQNYKKDEKFYNLYAKNFKIELSLFKFLQKDFLIKKISFTDAVLETYYEINAKITRQNKLQEIAKQMNIDLGEIPVERTMITEDSGLFHIEKFSASQFSQTNIPKIEIKNGAIISYDKFSNSRMIEEIKGAIVIDAEEIRAFGKFTNEKINNDFKFVAHFNSAANKQNSSLEIHSEAMNLKITGSFTSQNQGVFNSNFTGKIEAEIFELRNFYKNYINNSSPFRDKFKITGKPIKISGEIENDGGEISLNKMLISSQIINGQGSAVIDFSGNVAHIDINLDLENLDLDSIWSNEKIVFDQTKFEQKNNFNDDNQEQKNLPDENKVLTNENNSAANNDDSAAKDNVVDNVAENSEKNAINEQDLPNVPTDSLVKKDAANSVKINKNSFSKNFDLSSEIKIKTVKYLEDEITDVDLYLSSSNEDQILILPLILTVPGQAVLRLNGTLESNGILPKFIGKFDIAGQDLGKTFKWLQLELANLKFDSLKEYVIYSDLMLLPNNIKLSNFYLSLNKDKSEFLGEIGIDSNSKITTISNKFQISSFKVDDYFFTSTQNIYLARGSLLRKLLWLNDIPVNNDIDLTFDKLIYQNESFDQSAIKLRFGQGYINISELKLNSDKTNLQASLAIDISAKEPIFNINIIADNFYYSTEKNEESEQKNNVTIADQFFSLPSLEGFSGDVNIAITDLNLDDLAIKNYKLGGKLKEGLINNSVVTCDIYDGSFKYKGVIGIKDDKILNGVMTLKNAALEKLLPNLIGVTNVGGVANISGNITSIADSKKSFFKGTNSEIKFNVSSPIVVGYGLTDLVNKMFYFNNFREELRDPEKVLFNPNSQTTFRQAKGSISLDKEKGSKFSINLSAPLINGILSGKFDLTNNSIDGLANIIFITGSRQKQVPINIASSLKGDMKEIKVTNNLDQAKQYLGLIKIKPAEILPNSAPNSNNTSTPNAAATSNSGNSNPNQNSVLPPNQNNNQNNLSPSEKNIEQIKSVIADPAPK
ncbi:MAG: AsmA family protein [Rickettsiales bacterium]|nr:AsmA family protein [Rickettsiales bacterium]